MSSFFPEADPVLGNLHVRWIETAADLAAISLATEWDAATSVDLSCFLRPFTPGVSSNTGTAPDRICTTITLPQAGRTQIDAFELHYVYKAQEDDLDPSNAAKAALVQFATGILVMRKAIPCTTAGAAGQQYEAWQGRLDRQNRTRSGDDDQAEFEIMQNFLPTQDVVYGELAA